MELQVVHQVAVVAQVLQELVAVPRLLIMAAQVALALQLLFLVHL
jgi:hypothetical protein